MRVTALLIGVVLLPDVSLAESDVLLQAVSFAVTGSDASDVTVIDRKQCVSKLALRLITSTISIQTESHFKP